MRRNCIAPDIRPRLALDGLPLSLILIGYLAYELLIRAWLGRLLAANRLLPRGFQYLNVFIEISLPTVALLIGGSIISPLSILAGAIPFIYFLFILLRPSIWNSGYVCLLEAQRAAVPGRQLLPARTKYRAPRSGTFRSCPCCPRHIST